MKNPAFSIYLKKYANLINDELKTIFDDWYIKFTQKSSRMAPLFKSLQKQQIGGKRLRGVLLLLGYALCSNDNLSSKKHKALIRMAAAYEILQTALLIHDDIIDKSETRRSQKTLYRQFGNREYGIAQTISLGDFSIFMTYKLLAENTTLFKGGPKALAILSDDVGKTTVGEMLDSVLMHDKKNIEKNAIDEVLTMYRLKTAHYTFIAPLVFGASLAGANKKTVKALQLFGTYLGIAFQLRDDLNDIFPDQKLSNKDRGADIREGKQTVLIIKAMQQANSSQQKLLKNSYGKGKNDKQTIAVIQNLFIQTGAVAYVTEQIKNYKNDAQVLVSTITKDTSKQQLLTSLIETIA